MKRFFSICFLVVVLVLNGVCNAATLFESGTLGPTGIPWSDLSSGAVPGTFVSDTVFTGVRFQLNQPVVTTHIGGHFAAPDSGTFFGAIVELNDENDFPNSENLSTTDVLGIAVLTFPVPSDEVYGNLSLSLDPGWYAIVFGSGLFGATGSGGAPQNNTDIGNPTYIGRQPGSGWLSMSDLSTIFVDYRFVILGSIVPEPTSAALFLLASLLSLIKGKRGRQNH